MAPPKPVPQPPKPPTVAPIEASAPVEEPQLNIEDIQGLSPEDQQALDENVVEQYIDQFGLKKVMLSIPYFLKDKDEDVEQGGDEDATEEEPKEEY